MIVLLTGVLLVVGQLVGGVIGLAFAAVFAVGMFAHWKLDSLILTTMRAKEVTPKQAPTLRRIVERTPRESGLPMPKVYMIDTRSRTRLPPAATPSMPPSPPPPA